MASGVLKSWSRIWNDNENFHQVLGEEAKSSVDRPRPCHKNFTNSFGKLNVFKILKYHKEFFHYMFFFSDLGRLTLQMTTKMKIVLKDDDFTLERGPRKPNGRYHRPLYSYVLTTSHGRKHRYKGKKFQKQQIFEIYIYIIYFNQFLMFAFWYLIHGYIYIQLTFLHHFRLVMITSSRP